jgi:HEPN domain-containing protein
MNPLTLEWINKAEGDLNTAKREFRVRTSANLDAVGFHAQQCAEKYLKARIQEAGLRVRRTHDLCELLDVVQPVPLQLQALRPQLEALTRFAVEYRYPGTTATDKAAVAPLVSTMTLVRKLVRAELKVGGSATRKRKK